MSRLSRFLLTALLVVAFIVAASAFLIRGYFTNARKGALRRTLFGLIGGLVAWAIYAAILWHVVAG